jgi:hypothetical protein
MTNTVSVRCFVEVEVTCRVSEYEDVEVLGAQVVGGNIRSSAFGLPFDQLIILDDVMIVGDAIEAARTEPFCDEDYQEADEHIDCEAEERII